MTNSTQNYEKPGMVTALSIVTLISGILNIIYAVTLTGGIVLGTIGLGLLCAPFTLLPAVLGIFEMFYAIKLLANPPQPVQPSQTLAIFEISGIMTGSITSLIAGILALVFYNDGAVKDYFAWLNSGR